MLINILHMTNQSNVCQQHKMLPGLFKAQNHKIISKPRVMKLRYFK